MTNTVDERIAQAREFLGGARKRKVTELPPSLLIRECAELRRALGQVLDVIGDQAQAVPRLPVCGCGYDDCSACAIGQAEDGTEPYCTACGEWAGMFYGLEGWHHFRGDPAPGGQRELYDAGHEAVIGWTAPAVLAPAGIRTVLDALDVAAEYRRHPGLDRSGEYRELARRIGGAR